LSVVDRKGGQAQWSLRDPVVGEKVVLVYSVGDSVEYSEILRVLSVHQDNIVLSQSNVLRKGASGAVVVALKDFALLGLFVSVRGYDVICASFSARHLTQVTEADSVCTSGGVEGAGEEVGEATYSRMLHHGLGSYLDAINSSVAPIYVKSGSELQLAGTVANYAGSWRTTVDPTRAQLFLSDRQPLLFEQVGVNSYVCKSPPPVLTEVPATRTVVPGERVCIFARAGTDVIMSKVSRVAHYTVGAAFFTVEDFGNTSELLDGGLVVSERDACVLGQFVSKQYDVFGEPCAMCVSVPIGSVGLGIKPHESEFGNVRDVCVELLTSVSEFDDTDRKYHEALGHSAIEIFMARYNRQAIVGTRLLSITDIDSRSMDKLSMWLADKLGIASASLIPASIMQSRYEWLLGYLFAESRPLFDGSVSAMFGVQYVWEDSPGSAVTLHAPSRTGTPRLFRTYSSDIVKLQDQVDALAEMLRGRETTGE